MKLTSRFGAAAITGTLLVSTLTLMASPPSMATTEAGDESVTAADQPSITTGLQPSGRQLQPAGKQVTLGNYPVGAAVTADGRYAWTVSAGFSTNEIRIVDLKSQKVCRRIPLPGATGGIVLDSASKRAYVSGLITSRWQPVFGNLPGARQNTIQVLRWGTSCASATFDRIINVPPPADAPPVQQYPPPRSGLPSDELSWPQRLAISPDGERLLVPLNLADNAAVIDVTDGDRVRYVSAGSYPFGAGVMGRRGLVSNEASGTVSVVDLKTATIRKTITVGPPLSHPQGITIDRSRQRAYVALSASDQVVVINTKTLKVQRTISVGRSAGLGTMPVAVAISASGKYLYAAESGADELAVIQLPASDAKPGTAWTLIGRIPTASQPQSVVTTAKQGHRPARVLYLSAEGLGSGPNPHGPVTTSPTDPIFWAFSSTAPTWDVFAGVQYVPMLSRGLLGILPVPSPAKLARLSANATEQIVPTNAQEPPADTPLRTNGPIKHVFFIVRENRSYDQILGDDARGNGDPKLELFGSHVTPNLHALVRRFPLLDSVYANSEASIQGHYWTASAGVPDYVTRNWVQQYAARGRPNDFASYAVSWPGNGFIFNQAEKQHISYFNYGEMFMGGFPSVPDRDRTPKMTKQLTRVLARSDLGPPFGGCYPGDGTIGLAMDNGEIFDSSMPAGAPNGSYSHFDCFKTRFDQQLKDDDVPALNYISLTSDHTRGTQPGFPTPRAMVADSDLAIGQLVDTISHSKIWSSSAIFIVEDDSQDGSDHVNAHRIPVAVISPYARAGAVVHTRYDLVSAVRSIELILGMKPLMINDALATPMYDAFSSTANTAPFTAITPSIDLLERNGPDAPDSPWSSRLALDKPDQVSQADLDAILWHSVHGEDSPAPPPGPGAENEDEREP